MNSSHRAGAVVAWLTLGLILSVHGSARADEPAKAEIKDSVQGNWLGEWMLEGGGGGKQTAEIVALGKGEYQAAFTAYDGSEQQKETFRFAIHGTTEQEKVTFDTTVNLGEQLGVFVLKNTVREGKLTGSFTNNKNYTGTLELKRVEKRPAELGAKPLPGAIVLFDGKSLDRWQLVDGRSAPWKLVDGALQVTRAVRDGKETVGHIASRETFKDAQIHLEFRTPFLPEARGLERGRSGVLLQGRYEILILDGFGLPASDDGAAAIFRRDAPTENVSLPPGEWQSYDITYLAPRFDAAGAIERPAEITLRHNGTLVHDRVTVKQSTDGAAFKEPSKAAGLILRDGGQPVEFRNIWIVRLDG